MLLVSILDIFPDLSSSPVSEVSVGTLAFNLLWVFVFSTLILIT